MTARLVRHESELGRWELVTAVPDARLAGLVQRYCGFVEATPAPVRRLEAATTTIPLIIGFGPPIEVADARAGRPSSGGVLLEAFVAGVYDGPVVTAHAGAMHGVQVDLSPPAAHRLLRLSMHELANRVVALDEALGAAGRELAGRLAAAPDWAARFRLVDEFLLRRFAAAPEPPALVRHAWRRLEASAGRVSIGTLAAEVGVSRKHLAATFRVHVGLPPKPVARILRFSHALGLLRRDAVPSWAALAAECGYADQSHLVRDFHAFAGRPPSALAGLRLPDDGGWAAEAG